MTTVITVEGMHCNNCTAAVEKALSALPGVSAVSANLASGQVSIEQEGSVEMATICATVDDLGFEVVPLESDKCQ